jgi:hypothetical protein
MAQTWSPVPADEQAPIVSIGAPATGSTVGGTITVQVNASDNVGVTQVKLYAGATLIGSDDAAPYSFNLNATAYPNGALQLTASAFDAAGNESMSGAVDLTVYTAPVDNIPPTALITAPTENKTVSGTVTIKASASDNVALASMTLYVDDVQLCTGAGPALNCAWNAQAAARGNHFIKLIAADQSRNTALHQIRVKR